MAAANQEAINVAKDDFITSKSGPDKGSTFYVVSCKSCANVVGRVYKTTAANLDHIRNCYSLDRDALQSYELGSRNIKAGELIGELLHAASGLSSGDVAAVKTAVEGAKVDIVKLQEMLLLFNERLLQLERGEKATLRRNKRPKS